VDRPARLGASRCVTIFRVRHGRHGALVGK
jgi:hypothetical protein